MVVILVKQFDQVSRPGRSGAAGYRNNCPGSPWLFACRRLDRPAPATGLLRRRSASQDSSRTCDSHASPPVPNIPKTEVAKTLYALSRVSNRRAEPVKATAAGVPSFSPGRSCHVPPTPKAGSPDLTDRKPGIICAPGRIQASLPGPTTGPVLGIMTSKVPSSPVQKGRTSRRRI